MFASHYLEVVKSSNVELLGVLKCKKHCPLMISGQPGTGKSTLLSLIYLHFITPAESKKYIIDLHKFANLTYD